jgi:hypothetical protein
MVVLSEIERPEKEEMLPLILPGGTGKNYEHPQSE